MKAFQIIMWIIAGMSLVIGLVVFVPALLFATEILDLGHVSDPMAAGLGLMYGLVFGGMVLLFSFASGAIALGLYISQRQSSGKMVYSSTKPPPRAGDRA